LPATTSEILARFEQALSQPPDTGQAPRILSPTLNARRLLVVAPEPGASFGLDFIFSEERFAICLCGAPFAKASENPPADRHYRVVGPLPGSARPAIVFEAISYDDSARIEQVLALINSTTTGSTPAGSPAPRAEVEPASSAPRFAFDAERFAAWVARTSDPAHYRPCRGEEREVAQVIDELFADAQEAGAITPPAQLPYLEIDVRQSRGCVLVLVGGKPGWPALASRPLEVSELARGDGRGTRHAREIVACLIAHANELLGA
jgi:hypothetical protein